MTVAEAGPREGVLFRVASEAGLDTDEPVIDLTGTPGRINADLTVGTDVTTARPLKASAVVCSPGVKLHGAGFIVSPAQAATLGLGRRTGLERHIRPYRNGRDLTGTPRGAMVMDFYGLSKDRLRIDFPEAYQHLVETVKEARDDDGRLVGRDANPRAAYREQWWIFGEPRGEFRPALEGLPRYIATVETAKHRVFQFLDAETLPDNMLVCIADDDAATLAVLSSQAHLTWARARGGALEDRPRYTKTACFDPFPFPAGNKVVRADLRAVGEDLDRLRKTILAEHPDLTLTGLYNVLEAIRSGAPLDARAEDVKRRGLVIVLRDLHDDIDRLTARAYGWPEAIATKAAAIEVVARLTALNLERAREEAGGHIRWLRPAFQQPRAGRAAQPGTAELGLVRSLRPIAPARRRFPTDRYEQPLAIQAALAAATGPLGPPELARRFHGGGIRLEPRIGRVLMTLHRYGHVQRVPDGRWIATGPVPVTSGSPTWRAHAAT